MLQVAFFPYFPSANFDEKYRRVHFFNFRRFGEKYITNEKIRTRINDYCSLYFDTHNNTLDSPTIAVIDDNYLFSELDDQQIIDLFSYSFALTFSAIVNNSQDTRVYISEHFNLIINKFSLNAKPESEVISFVAGSIYKQHRMQTLDKTKFIRPDYVPMELFPFYNDTDIFVALSKMIDAHRPDDNRFLRVLEWCRFAYLNPTEYSPEIRYVMLAMAFEIFFDLPDILKADEFASRLETLLEVDKMVISDEQGNANQGLDKISRPNSRGKQKTNTIYGWWAREFYDLRSRIVHGDIISNQDIKNSKDQHHFEIALKIIQFCFYKVLDREGYLEYEEISPTLNDLLGRDYRKILKIDELHRKIENIL